MCSIFSMPSLETWTPFATSTSVVDKTTWMIIHLEVPFQGESKYPQKTYLEANTKLWHIRKSIFICKSLESYQENLTSFLLVSPGVPRSPRRREATNSRASHLCERYHCDACDLNLSRSPWKAQLFGGWATILWNDMGYLGGNPPLQLMGGWHGPRIQQIHVIQSFVNVSRKSLRWCYRLWNYSRDSMYKSVQCVSLHGVAPELCIPSTNVSNSKIMYFGRNVLFKRTWEKSIFLRHPTVRFLESV